MIINNKNLFALIIATVFSVSSPLSQAQIAANVRYDTNFPIVSPVSNPNGMVVTEQALATQVGSDILKRGGNAVDAAVAVGFALAVVLPNAGNIGGGGFMLIHDAKSGKDIALDFRELAPEKAHRDMYLDANGKVISNSSIYSHKAIGVPGTVAGLDLALRQYGTMRLAEVIAPAIRLAEQGFNITPHLASLLDADQEHLGKWPASRAIFSKITNL